MYVIVNSYMMPTQIKVMQKYIVIPHSMSHRINGTTNTQNGTTKKESTVLTV